MGIKKIVFESPRSWHRLFFIFYLCRGFDIWVVEPFHAYHYEEKDKARFYPANLPDYIWKYVNSGKIFLLKSKQFNPQDIYKYSANQAVLTVENVFSTYRQKYSCLIEYVSKVLKSKKSENMFRKKLCDDIAKFYSQNMIFYKIQECFTNRIILHPYGNILKYLYIQNLLVSSKQQYSKIDRIAIHKFSYLICVVHSLCCSIVVLMLLLLQILASIFSLCLNKNLKKVKKDYIYGVSIIGDRQLRSNKKAADYFVDEEEIHAKEVVFLPLVSLNSKQKLKLMQLRGDVFYPPSIKRNFTNFLLWSRLLRLSLSMKSMINIDAVKVACVALAEYFRWEKTLRLISIKHFVTHCDFSISHIARNIALEQEKITTWYFIDSMNSGNFSSDIEATGELHPFWTYLAYDNLVSWDNFISTYYSKHKNNFGNIHIVGCLWADHIRRKKERIDNKLIVAAFDSTYTCNSFTAYKEGMAYAQHLLMLVKDLPYIVLYMKEKKPDDYNYHFNLDSVNGPRLISFYKDMYKHPRVKKNTIKTDVSEILSLADIVISFPFTSTTFEALAANKPAIWHDPNGLYRNTVYAKVPGVVTHNYEELKNRVEEVNSGKWIYPFFEGSQLMDPFRDGKALDRFRELVMKNT